MDTMGTQGEEEPKKKRGGYREKAGRPPADKIAVKVAQSKCPKCRQYVKTIGGIHKCRFGEDEKPKGSKPRDLHKEIITALETLDANTQILFYAIHQNPDSVSESDLRRHADFMKAMAKLSGSILPKTEETKRLSELFNMPVYNKEWT